LVTQEREIKVVQDGILRADCQSALVGLLHPYGRVTNPQVANLHHKN
jgi:hypothetical protein